MTSSLILAVVAAVGGIAAALQAQFMGSMDQGMGTLESMFMTYVGGALLVSLPVLALRGGNLGAWPDVPWYAFGAGAMGLIVVGSIGYTVPRLGLVTVFTIVVTSQFMVGALLDHFGLLGATVRPLDLSRVLGVTVLLLGVWLITR